MKICRCCICKKDFWARNCNAKYCSDECRKAGNKINQAKGETRARYLMETYHSNTLDKTIQEAHEKGVSYGELQADKYKKLVTARKPKTRIEQMVEAQHSSDWEYRKQQFDEIVAQHEVGEWENQNIIGTESSKD